MVAVIKTGHSIHNIFNYNENKVKQGVAECIGEGNYPVDVDALTLMMKVNRLVRQAALNDNVKRNSVHISLNFDPSENSLPKDRLMEIAGTYMDKIGFGEQPYLVYQHHDAGHPHIHIVTVKIKADGNRIDTQNIGRNQSEAARKEIEKTFGLVVAEGRRNKPGYELQPITAARVNYGRSESKKAISNVLSAVLPAYKYASLAELNAVLQQYNVLADRGSENSRVFKGGGLVYRILDDGGKPTGVPIKASDFYSRPTLKYLEERFVLNKVRQAPLKSRVKNAIDLALIGDKTSLEKLVEVLAKDGIAVVFRRSAQGQLYGITYVDNKEKCVFNGSALGKQYSAKAIEERCGVVERKEIKAAAIKDESNRASGAGFTSAATDADAGREIIKVGDLADVLLQPEQSLDYLPGPLKGKRKKKKRRGQSDN